MSRNQTSVQWWQSFASRKIIIAEWQLELSAVIYLVIGLFIGFVIVFSGSIASVGALSIVNVVKDNESHLSAANLVSTEVVGTGNSAYVQLNEGSGVVGWLDTDWRMRRKLTFNNSSATEDLTDFPVVVLLTNSNFDFSDAQSAGQDIRFTDSDGTTLLSYEIEFWNSGTGNATIWVKVPQIDQASNTDSIYMYFDNPDATSAEDADAVWSNNYAAVYHMNNNPAGSAPQIIDSTSNNRHGTTAGTMNSGDLVAGKLGNAVEFDGSNDRIELPTGVFSSLTQGTVEAWTYWQGSVGGEVEAILSAFNGTCWIQWTIDDIGADESYNTWQDTNCGYVGGIKSNINMGSGVLDNAWGHMAFTVTTGVGNAMYGNGTLRTQTYERGGSTGTLFLDDSGVSGQYWIGNTPEFLSEAFTGRIDELRVSSVPRSSSWIGAQYSSMNGSYIDYSGNDETPLPSSGTWESSATAGQAIDLLWNGGWGDGTEGSTAFSATVANVSTGLSSVTFQMRVAQTTGGLSGASYVTLGTINTGTTFTATKADLDGLGLATGTNRYAQVRVTLSNTDYVTNPRLDGFTINYLGDDTDPSANASNIVMQKVQGGATVAEGGWTNNLAPYFTWDPGADTESGIRGYCLYLGTDNTGDPTITKGLLGTSPVDVTGTPCLFIVTSTNIDFNTLSLRGNTWLTTSNNNYYLNIRAIDNIGNIIDTSEQFSFKFDNTLPTNPTFISLPGDFVASKSVTFTWPTVGADAASDANSGLAGIQYRISAGGTWYGDNHNGQQDATDLLGNDGTYSMDETYDYPAIVDGTNVIYIRTWDVAGNVTIVYLTGVLKVNTTSPSAPQNLEVTPTNNTSNSYSFDWDAPNTYVGNVAAITYCYTVNVLPSSGTCTYTAGGVTNLAADSYATQPGENTFYVAARDEASNINYGAFAEVDFTYSGSAPGVPLSVDVSDISVKDTQNWRLVVSWSPPSNQGAGVSSYRIYRSTQDLTCTQNFGAFSQIGSTAGTSYTDNDLDQQDYYYCVRACDSANNCSAVSDTKSSFPDGRFTEAAPLTSGPTIARVSNRSATITWITGRNSDSKISFGLATNRYFVEEPARSEPVINHEINLNNLQPGTTYFARAKWLDEDGNLGTSEEFVFSTLPPPTVTSLIANNIGLDSANINFNVRGAAKARIRYGTTTNLGGVIEINTSVTAGNYTVEIPALLDGTRYFYKVNPVDSDGFEYETTVLDFTTIARPKISEVAFENVNGEPTPTVKVTWKTNTPTSTVVAYSPEGNPSERQTAIDTDYVIGDHEIVIANLIPDTNYAFTLTARDEYGNEVISETQRYATGLDSRPPRVYNVKIEPALISAGSQVGAQQLAQLIISWDTDEPSTSQVEFGQGTGDEYPEKTQRDGALTFNHLVVISNLAPSQVYHLRVLSMDEADNQGESVDTVTITPRASQSALEVILGNLGEIFSFLR